MIFFPFTKQSVLILVNSKMILLFCGLPFCEKLKANSNLLLPVNLNRLQVYTVPSAE